MKVVQGKVALVTGGDSGIGRAVCHAFALEGATVAFTYVKGYEDKEAMDTLQLIKQSKNAREPIALAADLGYDENCRRVVEEVVNAYGRIDILVNNAAQQYKTCSVEEIDEGRLERVFRTNAFSYFFTVRYKISYFASNCMFFLSFHPATYGVNRAGKGLLQFQLFPQKLIFPRLNFVITSSKC